MTIRTKLIVLSLGILSTMLLSCGARVSNQSASATGKTANITENKTEKVEELNSNNDKNVKVLIKTTAGDMTVLLYNETPLHKANFLKLVKSKFYDGVLFHRVIKEFMIQTGDPDSKKANKNQALGEGGPGYTLAAEFNPKLIHKKGALAAARLGDNLNPEKRSSGSQFYIVQGKKYNDDEIKRLQNGIEAQAYIPFIRKYLVDNPKDMARVQKMEQTNDRKSLQLLIDSITKVVKLQHPEVVVTKYTQEQLNTYKTLGGTPFLDMNYTVFGEVVEGLEIVDKIAAVETNAQDRPLEDVKIISMEIVK